VNCRIDRLLKWQREFVRRNCNGHVGRRIFKFELAGAPVVIQIFDNCAVRHAVSTGHLVVHITVHATVFVHLCGRTMQAILVFNDLKCHRTGLQRQIQPDSHKQTQGAAAPGLLLLSDSGEVIQVFVSTTILRVSLNSCA
jgi:hypothetical protein